MQTFNYQHEYIFFLQHPEKRDHYLIMQQYESTMHDLLNQFNRSGKYENGPATMPHNNVTQVEKIPVPDKSLFGLYYFICNELGEVTYCEDERWPYAEWGWYIIEGALQTSKWLQQYMAQSEERKSSQKAEQKTEAAQMSLF